MSAIGLRASSRVIEISARIFGVEMSIPSWYSGRLWLMRLGYYKLNLEIRTRKLMIQIKSKSQACRNNKYSLDAVVSTSYRATGNRGNLKQLPQER